MSIPDTLEIGGKEFVAIESDAMPAAFADMRTGKQAQFFNDLGAIYAAWGDDHHGENRWRTMSVDLDENGKAVLRAMAHCLAPAGG